MYYCDKCSKNFLRVCDLASHCRWEHKKQQEFECQTCGKKFEDNCGCKIHEKYCKNTKEIIILNTDLCDYGCQQKAKFILKCKKKCCSKSHNSCPEIRKKNHPKGSSIQEKNICEKCQRLISVNKYKTHQQKCRLSKEIIDLIKKKYNELETLESIKKSLNLTYGDIEIALKNHPKRNLRNVFLLSHKQGRSSSWKYKNSYAERFFEKFLNNNGFKKDVDYIREKAFSFYRVDFFFPNLSVALEIDGQQHVRLRYQIEIDKRKNLFLKLLDIKVIRIFWKDLFENTQEKLSKIAQYLNGEQIDISSITRKLEYPENLKLKSVVNKYKIVQKQETQLSNKRFVKKLVIKKICKKKIIEEKHKQNVVKEALIRQALIKERIEILKMIDMSKRGWIKEACEKLKITHTSVRRFLRLHLPELEGKTYFKPRLLCNKKYQMNNWHEYYNKM